MNNRGGTGWGRFKMFRRQNGLCEEDPDFADVDAPCHVVLAWYYQSCSCKSPLKSRCIDDTFFLLLCDLKPGHSMNNQANYNLLVLARSQCINIGTHFRCHRCNLTSCHTHESNDPSRQVVTRITDGRLL